MAPPLGRLPRRSTPFGKTGCPTSPVSPQQRPGPDGRLHHLNLLPKSLQSHLLRVWNRDGCHRDLEDVLQAVAGDPHCAQFVEEGAPDSRGPAYSLAIPRQAPGGTQAGGSLIPNGAIQEEGNGQRNVLHFVNEIDYFDSVASP